MANYLVTGGAGFIGSSLVEALLERGHAVRVLDNFATGRRENIAPFLPRIELIEGSLTSVDDVRQAVRDMDVILHHGAIPSVPRSIDDPVTSNEVNVTGTLHVLNAAREFGAKRVVFASSSSIYGDQDEESAKVETMRSYPISPYGVSKLAAEAYCQAFHIVYGLETVSLRYFNVFGPRQDPKSTYAAVIPRFITALLQGTAPTIYGDGEQTRDFTFVGNVVAGNLLAAESPAERVAGEVFNLATGGQVSLNMLFEMLQEMVGSNIQPIYETARTGDIKYSRADISKAYARMNYEPRIPFADGLNATVQWYRQQTT
ncbi:MAG: SDR family oxidoreductase [Anaerolineae bacterium]|nr:SDR family oxidoreductase [Anaerolineae bacterium]